MGAALVAAFILVGASVAWACIPWAGKLELTNLNDGNSDPEENSTTVWGADHTDVNADGSTPGDRGNGQGMVWCDVDDADAGQQYRWAEVATSGDSTNDVKLTVTGSDHECDSNVKLPEDKYSITYQEDSFDNHDDSTNGSGEETFADNEDAPANASSIEVAEGHCMDLDDTDPDGDPEWNLIEDDDGDFTASRTDGDSTWFPDDGIDAINQGPHSIDVDLDQFSPDPSESGHDQEANNDSDGDGHFEAAGLCITSYNEYEHDNNTQDTEDDSEVEGGNKEDDGSGEFNIEYGNAVPVNILSTS